VDPGPAALPVFNPACGGFRNDALPLSRAPFLVSSFASFASFAPSRDLNFHFARRRLRVHF
jgi:hypothetical protein